MRTGLLHASAFFQGRAFVAVPKLGPFLERGIFVPEAFFSPALLGFVPPGTLEPEQRQVAIWIWALFAIVLGVSVFAAARSPMMVSHGTAYAVAYALVGQLPLAFALDLAAAEASVLLFLAFTAVGYVAEPVEEAGRLLPWVMAAAILLPSALALAGLPAFGMVLTIAVKAWLDHSVLQTLHQGSGYGRYRRWLTVGGLGYGWLYTLATPEVGADAAARGLASVGAALLAVVCIWLAQNQLQATERTLLAPVPEDRTLSRESSHASTFSRATSGSHAFSRTSLLLMDMQVPTTALAVLTLGVGKGALLPHALATRLISGGFPAHVTGVATLVTAAVEFLVLSLPPWCLPSRRMLLTLGLILTGVHLQVVCAMSGANWLFVLPAAATVGGCAAACVALAVPLLVDSAGGVCAQGCIQGLEFLGIAGAILLVPHIVEASGSSTFVFQIVAYLLIVAGILCFLQPLGTKSSDLRAEGKADDE